MSDKLPRGVFEKVPGSKVFWICYWDAEGRRRREKAGSKSNAIDLYRKRKADALTGKKLPEKLRAAPLPFSQIADDALAYSKANKVLAAYQADKWHMETVRGWFGTRAAADIKPQDIEGRLSDLAETLKPATVNRYRALLSLTYSIAMRNGKVTANPARLVKLRKENNARVRFLSAEEEAKLCETILLLCPDGEAEFDLALNTGMRRGEQYRLRWQDVNLKSGVITIPRSKNGEKRHVQINSTAHKALETIWARRTAPGYVCPGKDGERSRGGRRWFERCVTAAGLDNFHWHDLRHTFASRLVMAGVDLRTVQELMGHKVIAMTVRYAHLNPTHLQAAVDRLTPTATTTATEAKAAFAAGDTNSRKRLKIVGAGGGT